MAARSMMAGRMILVVDASVAVKFVTEEAGSDQAYEIVAGPDPLIAPDWLLVEVASAMWNKVKHSKLLETHAEDSFDNLPRFFAQLFPAKELLKEAFQLSFRLHHPVYDCLYLALAQQEQAVLVTADKAFMRAIERTKLGAHARLLEWPQGGAVNI